MVKIKSGPYNGYQAVVVKLFRDKLDKPLVRLLYNRSGEKLSKPFEVDLRNENFAVEVVV